MSLDHFMPSLFQKYYYFDQNKSRSEVLFFRLYEVNSTQIELENRIFLFGF